MGTHLFSRWVIPGRNYLQDIENLKEDHRAQENRNNGSENNQDERVIHAESGQKLGRQEGQEADHDDTENHRFHGPLNLGIVAYEKSPLASGIRTNPKVGTPS